MATEVAKTIPTDDSHCPAIPRDAFAGNGAAGPSAPGKLARLIAFYLPQFHPIPENDAWWGRGFTEWTNVAKSVPLFPGHYQPHLPAHLGFCDLRVPHVREKQADYARAHGIEAFCYWHYWFHGRRLLGRPLDEVRGSGKPDFPYCLAWANETWSRRWLGEERDILLQQSYSADDDRAHVEWLLDVFADSRYLRVGGRPVFLVYRPGHHPDPSRLAETFRDGAARRGQAAPYLIGVNSFHQKDWRSVGFDANVDFEPLFATLPNPMAGGLKIYDYQHSRQLMWKRNREFPGYPCVFVSWDNTPRRGGEGIVFTGSSPDAFEAELRETVESTLEKPYEDRLVFVNAWNEWAEGNHLEPDQKYGLGYLEAVRRVNCVGWSSSPSPFCMDGLEVHPTDAQAKD